MSEAPPTTPFDMGAGRLEAFSDAVMAVIITLLAFELEPPTAVSRAALREALPGLFIYVLCFLFIAIYWNNHHHLLRATDRISAATMWANMLLLFCLSLIPVSAEWMRTAARDDLDPRGPAAFFGIVGLAAALSYTWLVRALIRANGRDSVARARHPHGRQGQRVARPLRGGRRPGGRQRLPLLRLLRRGLRDLADPRPTTHAHARRRVRCQP